LVSFDTTAYLRLALELSDQALRALQAAAMGSKERDAVREALREIRHFSWPLAGYANEFRQRIERLARGASAGATRGGGGGAMGGGSMGGGGGGGAGGGGRPRRRGGAAGGGVDAS
jgi:hypothetical protein